MGAGGLEFHETQSPDTLERQIASAQAAACWALCQMLARIAAYDRERYWKLDGAQDMVAWLVRAQGLSSSTARDYVVVAHKLQDLPQIAKTFEAGLLSFDQVRALCRFATPDTDTDLAERARGLSVAELHRLARTHEPVSAADDVDTHKRRSLRFRLDYRDRMTHFSGALAPEAGAALKAAIVAHADRCQFPGCVRTLWVDLHKTQRQNHQCRPVTRSMNRLALAGACASPSLLK